MEQQQFEITIDYDKTSDRPERVFNAMALIITEFTNIDKMLCDSLSIKIQTKFEIESVENGSLKAIFKQILENSDDDAIKNLDWKKLIGSFLLKGKYLFLSKLNDEKEIATNSNKINELQEDIFQASKNLTLNPLKTTDKIPSSLLLKRLDGLNKSFCGLNEKDKVIYRTPQDKIDTKFNPNFSYESYKELIAENKMTTQNQVNLIIKKPDYLGESQWEFKFGNAPILAKIADEEWLKKFQNREIMIQPKDSIECDLEITTYSLPHSKSEISYIVKKIKKVLPYAKISQQKLKVT